MRNTAKTKEMGNSPEEPEYEATPLPFRISVANWLGLMFFHIPWAYWSLSISGFLGIAAIICGFAIDIRWAICGLMIILLVLPMISCMLFFYYGMKTLNAINLSYHTIEISADHTLLISIFTRQERDTNHREDAGGNREETENVIENGEDFLTEPEFRISRQFSIASEILDINHRIAESKGDWFPTRDKEWLYCPISISNLIIKNETDKR